MINIEIKYNGKKVNNLGDAMMKGFVEEIKKNVKKSLIPLEKEIKKHGGRIKVDISKDLKIKITCYNLSEEMEQKISLALK